MYIIKKAHTQGMGHKGDGEEERVIERSSDEEGYWTAREYEKLRDMKTVCLQYLPYIHYQRVSGYNA